MLRFFQKDKRNYDKETINERDDKINYDKETNKRNYEERKAREASAAAHRDGHAEGEPRGGRALFRGSLQSNVAYGDSTIISPTMISRRKLECQKK